MIPLSQGEGFCAVPLGSSSKFFTGYKYRSKIQHTQSNNRIVSCCFQHRHSVKTLLKEEASCRPVMIMKELQQSVAATEDSVLGSIFSKTFHKKSLRKLAGVIHHSQSFILHQNHIPALKELENLIFKNTTSFFSQSSVINVLLQSIFITKQELDLNLKRCGKLKVCVQHSLNL